MNLIKNVVLASVLRIWHVYGTKRAERDTGYPSR